MDQITRIGMDTSKQMFQLHGVDGAERVVLRRKLRRGEVLSFFERLAPAEIGPRSAQGRPVAARIIGRARCSAWAIG